MWVITKDFTDEENVGVCSNDFQEERRGELAYKFRMYDDDDVLYCEGLCHDNNFDPLDDYGEGALGCTSIYYLNSNNNWELL